MASIYDIKPKFQNLLRPVVQSLFKAGVTANQITVLAMIISIVAGALIALFPSQKWPLLVIPLVLFIRMALNAIDGMLAREHNMKSALGAILNELGDVVSDAALYLPLALIPGLNPIAVILIVVLGIIGEMTGVIAVQIGTERRYDGPMGKSDRAFWLGLVALLMGVGLTASIWINIGLMLIAILSAVTILNRGKKALEALK